MLLPPWPCSFLSRKDPEQQTGRVRRFIAVVLTAVSLFPCVSATDDEFCFSLLQTSSRTRGGVGAPLPEDSKDQVGRCLARVLESLDHYQVSAAYGFAVIFWFIGLVLLATKLVSVRHLLYRAGRFLRICLNPLPAPWSGGIIPLNLI
jgi:hypothetical protein